MLNNKNKYEETLKKFQKFLDIIYTLRDPNKGCPWDREQTLDSMKDFFLEECYELQYEINKNDYKKVAEELGDILLLITLCAKIGDENKWFNMCEILDQISDKIIERHPHVFKNETVKNSDDVIYKWDEIKRKKHNKTLTDDLKMHLPPMLWAYKVQKKLANIGFDFSNYNDTIRKVREEIEELESEISSNNKEKIEDEIGDIFFSLINLSRHLSINPETALTKTILKFIDRVKFIEENAQKHFNKEFKELSLTEMDFLWELSKKEL